MKVGCSSFSWSTEDGKHLLGRTYDQFGDLSGNRVVAVPRGRVIQTEIQRETKREIPVTYGFVGMAVLGLSTPIMVDGVNERGLMVALLNYPGCAVYETQRGAGQLDLHPAFFTAYLLGTCATAEEVCAKIPGLNLTDEPIFGKEMRVHYMVSDPTGEAVILEPDEGGISVHRNSLGVMTNSPDYRWHTTHLRSYVAVDNLHKPPRELLGREFAGFGEGAGGGFGLPGDYSSPARFVRLAFMKHYAVRGKDETDGVGRMFHNFAPVDIPEGILRAGPDRPAYEQSLCTSVMCAESRTYYFATPTNRRIRAVRLERALKNGEELQFDLGEQQDILYLI